MSRSRSRLSSRRWSRSRFFTNSLCCRATASPSIILSPQLLERALTTLRAELEQIARKREGVWELHVGGKVREDDVQERLDTLAMQRDETRARIAAVQEQIAIAKAASARVHDVQALVAHAAELFESAAETAQRAFARAFAIELGGLCVEADGTLAIRAVFQAAAQRRCSLSEVVASVSGRGGFSNRQRMRQSAKKA